MTTDISRNPVTGRQVFKPAQIEQFQARDAARTALKDVVGYKPLDERRHGEAKLKAFFAANAFLGIVGWAGKMVVTNSSIMNSQKGGVIGALRDLGQTYYNATEDQGAKGPNKFLRNMTKIWSHIPELLGLGIPFAARVLAEGSHEGRLIQTFAANYRTQFGKPPSPELLKGLSVEKLRGLASTTEAAAAEARNIRLARPDVHRRHEQDLTVEEIMGASPNLKAHFVQELAKENAFKENDLNAFYGLDWARSLNIHSADADAPPPLVHADPNFPSSPLATGEPAYRLNAFQVFRGYGDLVKDGAEHQLDLSARPWKTDPPSGHATLKKAWDAAIDAHMPAGYRDEWNGLVDRRVALRRALAGMPESNYRYAALRQDLNEVEQKMARMMRVKLSPEASKAFGPLIQQTYDEAKRLAQPAAQAVSAVLVTPEEKRKTAAMLLRENLASEPNGASLVFDQVKEQYNETIARRTFQQATGAEGPDGMGPMDRSTLTRLEVALQKDKAAELADDEHQFDAPISQNSWQVRAAANLAASSAKLDGQEHREEFGDNFKAAVQGDLNDTIAHMKQHMAARGTDFDLYYDTIKETRTADYEIGGKPLFQGKVDPLTTDHEIQDRLLAAADEAQIPRDHFTTISTILHQGMLGSRGSAAMFHPEHTAMPFSFGHFNKGQVGDGDLDADVEKPADHGAKFTIKKTNEAGVYAFTAKMKDRLANVQDNARIQQALKQREQFDERTLADPEKSHFEVAMSGTIDCNQDPAVITLTGGHTAYKAEAPAELLGAAQPLAK